MLTHDEIQTIMSNEQEVRLHGACILYLADLLRDRQIMLAKSIKIAPQLGMKKDDLSDLRIAFDANEVMGGLLLKMVSEVFGAEFMEAYITGNVNLPDPPSVSILN